MESICFAGIVVTHSIWVAFPSYWHCKAGINESHVAIE